MQNLFNKNEILGEDLESLLEKRLNDDFEFLLIDVRERYEFDQKSIVGVDHLIPMSSFWEDIEKIKGMENKPIVVQCKSGARSAMAQSKLENLGFKKVVNLSGGIIKYAGKINE